jgi:hypothetical protein
MREQELDISGTQKSRNLRSAYSWRPGFQIRLRKIPALLECRQARPEISRWCNHRLSELDLLSPR